LPIIFPTGDSNVSVSSDVIDWTSSSCPDSAEEDNQSSSSVSISSHGADRYRNTTSFGSSAWKEDQKLARVTGAGRDKPLACLIR
jgi:hypothetical protein